MSHQRLFFMGVFGAVFVALVSVLASWMFFAQQEQRDGEGQGKLFFTTMTHMESNFRDDVDEDLFLRHVDQLRYAMDLFDEYGAKLTIESEAPFARANTTWGVNVLQEVIDRGHGVGTHADFGASPMDRDMTLAEMTQRFVENKDLVDALVGSENNRGVSGGTGYPDWVLAASGAGFQYMDAVTGFGYLAMPLAARPEGWTDAYIRSVGYHDPIPVDFVDRLFPLPLANAKDLVADEDPAIVLLGGDIGELASLSEGRNACFPDCVFDEDDVAVVKSSLDEALALQAAGSVARVNMHIPLSLLVPENEPALRSLLGLVQAYVADDKVLFATQGESFDAYEATLR